LVYVSIKCVLEYRSDPLISRLEDVAYVSELIQKQDLACWTGVSRWYLLFKSAYL